jgi:hypothetical protein
VPSIAQWDRTDTVPPPRKGGNWWKVLLVLLVIVGLLVAAGIYALNKVSHYSLFNAPSCTATSSTGSISLDLDQARYASTIAAVGTKLDVPAFGIEVAEATAMQESKLHNLTYGDRDSLGLFQQRPSQGWGTQSQIMDPVYSSTMFYEALLKVPGWQNLPLTQAAQAVQHSGAPGAYAQHQGGANIVEAVFTGTVDAALRCTLDGPTFAPQTKGAALLTGRSQAVLDELRNEYGASNVGAVGAIAADGLSFDVSAPADLGSAGAARRCWAFAAWATAQAANLGIAQVSYGGKVWSVAQDSAGWRASGTTDSAVHIVMVSGS